MFTPKLPERPQPLSDQQDIITPATPGAMPPVPPPVIPTPVQPPAPRHHQQTFIARGVRIEGEFVSQGDVTIEGELVGSLNVEGTLTLGSTAFVKANIFCGGGVLAGQVVGNVDAKDRLEIQGTGRIAGDLTCQTFVVQSGARLRGMIKTGEDITA